MNLAVIALLAGILTMLTAIFVALVVHVLRHWDKTASKNGNEERNYRDYAGTTALNTSLSSLAITRRPGRQATPRRLKPGFGPPPEIR